ncbi:hypothetical protein ACQ856_18220 [Mycolicibacterium psychrotolerans]|uniref:hypothetical protein n=1 Tax=Mycolicibacterium psychrotolerans TaxID=216929 RepID=UPI003D67D2B3
MNDTYAVLDFTITDQRDAEWDSPDGTRYRFMDRSTGTGYFQWVTSDFKGDWLFRGVMVYGGPFTRVPAAQELGDDADWDEGWVIEA